VTQETSKTWNDINLPSFSSAKKSQNDGKGLITGVGDQDSIEDAPENQVRIISAEWVPGPEGFQYNKECFLDVKAEYLKETIRARIIGNLFGTYNGIEEDLNQVVEGFIDKETGIARIKIKNLWFVNLDHYKAWLEKKSTPCKYSIKNISHSRGENVIDSEILELPRVEDAKKGILKVRIPIDPAKEDADDDVYMLFSTDSAATYSKTLSVRDDKIKGDNFLDLEFTDMVDDLKYSLKVLPGNKDKGYLLFEEQPFGAIV
jgi:hypothetical protein